MLEQSILMILLSLLNNMYIDILRSIIIYNNGISKINKFIRLYAKSSKKI